MHTRSAGARRPHPFAGVCNGGPPVREARPSVWTSVVEAATMKPPLRRLSAGHVQLRPLSAPTAALRVLSYVCSTRALCTPGWLDSTVELGSGLGSYIGKSLGCRTAARQRRVLAYLWKLDMCLSPQKQPKPNVSTSNGLVSSQPSSRYVCKILRVYCRLPEFPP